MLMLHCFELKLLDLEVEDEAVSKLLMYVDFICFEVSKRSLPLAERILSLISRTIRTLSEEFSFACNNKNKI